MTPIGIARRTRRSVWLIATTLRWIFVVTWRGVSGRWYIFRDAPLQIVVLYGRQRNAEDETMAALGRQAHAELKLRLGIRARRNGWSEPEWSDG